MKSKVAVIGAGAAGIAALRQLDQHADVLDAVCFEKADVVGGLWVYTDKVKDDKGQPVNSAMYKNLRVNLPKQIIGFDDLALPDHLPDFFTHEDMLQYLTDYVEHYKLKHYIKFNTEVDQIRPLPQKDGPANWEVQIKSTHSPAETKDKLVFDAIMVCVGQESVGYIPCIPGLQEFRGRMLHSHDYRCPDEFAGFNRVLFVGCGVSGLDIGLQLAPHVNEVLLSSFGSNISSNTLGDNAQFATKVPVTQIKAHSVILENGEEIEVEAIIFSSGYQYSFPFLTPECHVAVELGRVSHVWMHCIHTEFTTLAFIGLTKSGLVFKTTANQARLFIASLTGQVKLPSRQQMEKEEKEEDELRRKHRMRLDQKHKINFQETQPKSVISTWEYNKCISQMVGIKPIPPVIREIGAHNFGNMIANYATMKEYRYTILDNNTFTVTRVHRVDE